MNSGAFASSQPACCRDAPSQNATSFRSWALPNAHFVQYLSILAGGASCWLSSACSAARCAPNRPGFGACAACSSSKLKWKPPAASGLLDCTAKGCSVHPAEQRAAAAPGRCWTVPQPQQSPTQVTPPFSSPSFTRAPTTGCGAAGTGPPRRDDALPGLGVGTCRSQECGSCRPGGGCLQVPALLCVGSQECEAAQPARVGPCVRRDTHLQR